MVWIYLAESEESPTLCENGLSQWPTVKSMHTAKECSSLIWNVDGSMLLPSGTIYGPFLHTSSPPSTSFMEAFHARISLLLEIERVWEGKIRACFTLCMESLTILGRGLYSWKIPLESFPMEEWRLWKKLPPSGMTFGGSLKVVDRSEPPIPAKDGLCLPTPKASDSKRRDSPSERRRHSPDLTAFLNMMHITNGKLVHPHFIEWMMTYPLGWTELTPSAIAYVLSKRKKLSKS